MTSLSNILLYPQEHRMLIEAGLLKQDQQESIDVLTTDNLRERAKTIISDVEEQRRTSCISRLSYALNLGPTARRVKLAKDLKTVAKDIEERKDCQDVVLLGTLVNSLTRSVIDTALGLISKRGFSAHSSNHYYLNRY